LRNLSLIQMLLEHGADPFVPDGDKHSAHQIAVWINNPDMLALFPEKPETSQPSA